MSEYDQMRLYREGLVRSQAIADERKKMSKLKSYGWGIVYEPTGQPGGASRSQEDSQVSCDWMNRHASGDPYRVVQLFYMEGS